MSPDNFPNKPLGRREDLQPARSAAEQGEGRRRRHAAAGSYTGCHRLPSLSGDCQASAVCGSRRRVSGRRRRAIASASVTQGHGGRGRGPHSRSAWKRLRASCPALSDVSGHSTSSLDSRCCAAAEASARRGSRAPPAGGRRKRTWPASMPVLSTAARNSASATVPPSPSTAEVMGPRSRVWLTKGTTARKFSSHGAAGWSSCWSPHLTTAVPRKPPPALHSLPVLK
mmetsp:Transcript_35098/g.83268  ORF Transcript_35098/g.83268 Transcript_35098/m.83268 type:complete len:227 (-) Transcript_35098:1466-2146(-)